MGFDIALNNVLMTLLYILPGFIVCKGKKAKPEHQFSLSGVLIYGCSPCLIFSTLYNLAYSKAYLKEMLEFFVATLLLQALFIFLIFLILRKRFAQIKYRVMTIGTVLGNVGFFGLPIIKALMPDHPEVACYSAVFMISMNVFVFTVAVFCLTGEKKYISAKPAVLNPSTLSFFVGLAFYAFQWKLPVLVSDAVTTVGTIATPLCMVILGIRLASVPNLGKIFTRPLVYLTCLGKLLVFPLFSYALISLFPVSYAFKCSILILCGAPNAAVFLSMAEMHNAEQELVANCVLVSTLFCVVTIPLLTLLA